MELIDVLLGGLLTWAGVAYGGRRARLKADRKQPKQPKPVCICKHGWGHHENGGSCKWRGSERVLVERGKPREVRTGYNGMYVETTYDHEKWESREVGCNCRHYTGPEPMPTMVAM